MTKHVLTHHDTERAGSLLHGKTLMTIAAHPATTLEMAEGRLLERVAAGLADDGEVTFDRVPRDDDDREIGETVVVGGAREIVDAVDAGKIVETFEIGMQLIGAGVGADLAQRVDDDPAGIPAEAAGR